MENDSKRREETKVVAENNYLLDQNCTFEPTFHMKARSQHHYDYLDGGGFMERMENDNERRRRKELKYKAMRKQAW
eukprot:CAMPEP_0204887460 /NCGR_PEP_ID=MMETSP1349-20130617/17883_1 /ASSEMBLY_ACC=CAM_ASM_000710 /TAXON_ID=215587 /ORGANISM="Aplanochytrium stocchinoi, Strain GSBS06" /LENGTH=75 /DNA_ID=CAMNT_0052050247 /DNA_START=504 /DNA_END=728 /DNA_ORIENTATION=+